MTGRGEPFLSMNDALSIPFDALRSYVHNAQGTQTTSSSLPAQTQRRVLGSPQGGTSASLDAWCEAEGTVPEAEQELDVYVTTKDPSNKDAISRILTRRSKGEEGVSYLDASTARGVVKGKEDFVLFDDMGDALDQGKVVVISCDKGSGRGAALATDAWKTAQCYLLENICGWFMQKKVDGAGQEYDEAKNFDPITKKTFTRNQILCLLDLWRRLTA
ncbi:hypothetical protein HOP50_15g75720 [Chloropicon primus]|uniref:Uncharacterized protein n=1 Tax=Chloropicon primus TaxID=1764295 RepID=A0A5B8MWT3_9CHLO|nr:hypothetical protein A3770_15p75470 [Chloropicon primus]UPR04237.1 hypothetical protein HOP50_15g75720 [Chloropicon primus]|eukprot:QDZ25029.1 hypothetical protein A3770_15p75470 [Chloropicon primus]